VIHSQVFAGELLSIPSLQECRELGRSISPHPHGGIPIAASPAALAWACGFVQAIAVACRLYASLGFIFWRAPGALYVNKDF